MLETLEDRKTKWINYLKQVPVNEQWKQKLCDEKALGISTQVYLFYPELFWNVFQETAPGTVPGEYLDKLCIAGYLYFGAVILQDKIIDNNRVDHYENLLQISWMQEEALRILHTMYEPGSFFWKLWVKRRNEYFASVELQKQSASLSLKQYVHLADGKAAFGKVAIDCCYALFKNKTTEDAHQRLIQSHTYFSIGNQLLDDLEDLDEDFKLGQINWALQLARNDMQENGVNGDVQDVSVLKKYVYISGLYEKILNLAEEYLVRAQQIMATLKGAERWAGCIMYKKKKIAQRRHIFSIYTKELFVKTHYSSQRLIDVQSVSPPDCLVKAAGFVFKQQNKTGSWTDMVTNAGFSNVWTTGFVLRNVHALEGYEQQKLNAVQFLHHKKIPQSLWGYSDHWMIADADSTTNVLMALHLSKALNETDVTKWMETFKAEEGLRTYQDADTLKAALPEFKQLSGWMQAHDCVTALGLDLLSRLPGEWAGGAYHALKYYIMQHQNQNALWDGYWWTSSLYTTCHILKALITKEWEKEQHLITTILGRLLEMAHASGSFGTAYDTESAFYTALVLDTVCSAEPVYHMYRKEADLMAQWLMQNQYADGSFNASYILRIPAPHIHFPDHIKNWSTEAHMPVNVVKKDIMRLYATSMVCSAMVKYNQFLT